MQVGWVLKLQKPSAEYPGFYLAVKITRFAVISIEVEGHSKANRQWKYFMLKPAAEQKVIFVTNLMAWVAVAVEIASPCTAAKDLYQLGARYTNFEPVLVPSASPPERLDCLAARHGFKGYSVPLLSKFATFLGCVFRGNTRPKNLRSWLMFLCRKLIPELTDEELNAIVEARVGNTPTEQIETVLCEGENQDLIEEVMHEDETEDAQEDLAKYVKKQKAALAATGTNRPAAGTSSAATSGSGGDSSSSRSTTAVNAGGFTYTPAWMKQWLPQVMACYIKRDTERQKRFQVGYPTVEPPRSKTVYFKTGDPVDELRAYKMCLHWAWDAHTKATGIACPYNLDEIQAEP